MITCYKSIDVIYIDPPYNTGGSDLTYEDKFSKNAWLNMMKQRMEITYQLLSDDGVIFVSLDDNMQAYFKVMMDGIFGEENFICNFIWEKNYSLKNNNKFVSENHDYVLCYAKNKNYLNHFGRLDRTDENNELYKYDDYDGRGKYRLGDLTTKGLKGYSIIHNGIEYKEKAPNGWRFNEDEMNNKIKNNEIYFPKKPNGIPQLKRYLRDVEGVISATILPYTLVGHTDENQKILDSIIDFTEKGNRKFNYPKGTKLIKYLINLCPKKDHQIILDFFAGSGTTGQAVLELNKEDGGNRQFILCQVDTSKKNDKGKEIKENAKSETTKQLTLDDLDEQDKKERPKLNIAYDVCYERLYRITTGKGTNGETFDWLRKKNDHNQQNEPFYNALDVYSINEIDISLKNNPHAEFLKKIDFSIYNKLYHDVHLDDKLNPELNLNIDNASTILYPLLDHIKE